jgi:uncharacterized membrane protein YsdA (DUF1294 family)
MTLNLFMAITGVVVFTVGGLIASHYWEKRKRIPIAVAFILLIVGGYMSNIFWNKYFRHITDEKTRKEIIHFLMDETNYNLDVLDDRKFQEPNDSNLSKFVFFPRFSSIAFENALNSHLFLNDPRREFLPKILNLNKLTLEANKALDETMIYIYTSKDPSALYTLRKAIRDGQRFRDYRDSLVEFQKMLAVIQN